MAGLGSLLGATPKALRRGETARLTIRALEEDVSYMPRNSSLRKALRSLAEPRPLQYYPETLSVTPSIELSSRSAVGLSHPIREATKGGGRSLSFTVFLTCDRDPTIKDNLAGQIGGAIVGAAAGGANAALRGSAAGGVAAAAGAVGSATSIALGATGNTTDQYWRNVPVDDMVGWLHSFLMFDYDSEGRLRQPPRLILKLEGSSISGPNSPEFLCVMDTGPQVQVTSFFSSGKMRTAEVSLAFLEVGQRSGSYLSRGLTYPMPGEQAFIGFAGNVKTISQVRGDSKKGRIF